VACSRVVITLRGGATARALPATTVYSNGAGIRVLRAERNLNAGRPAPPGVYAWLVVVIGLHADRRRCVVGDGLDQLVPGSCAERAGAYFTARLPAIQSPRQAKSRSRLPMEIWPAARRELTAWKRFSDPTFHCGRPVSQEEVVRQSMRATACCCRSGTSSASSSGSSCCVCPMVCGALPHGREHSARVWSRAPIPPTPADALRGVARRRV